MNNKKKMLLAAAVLLLANAATARGPSANLIEPVSFSSLKAEQRDHLSLPLDKTYEELTFRELDLLRNQYTRLRNSEEPPYPVDGLKGMVTALNALQARDGLRGELHAVIEVDATGRARNVSWRMTPDQGALTDIRAILLETRYKPAKCGARTCAMEFPLHIDFGSRAL